MKIGVNIKRHLGLAARKTLSWQAFRGMTTFAITLYVTGNAGVAASIALTEIASKAPLYLGHEGLWLALTREKSGLLYMRGRFRSVVKTLTYRILGTAVTSFLTLAYTHKWNYVLPVAILDFVLKMAGYYLHEEYWRSTEKTGNVHKEDIPLATDNKPIAGFASVELP